MSRYDGVDILRDDKGRRYLKGVKYPTIVVSENDIYIISTTGDTLDLLAEDYYRNVEDYWIIAVANGLSGDCRYILPGTQLRIPSDTETIKRNFRELNNIL